MTVKRDQLDRAQISGDADGHSLEEGMYLHSGCHRDVPMWAFYKDGEVRLECAECDREVITFAVKESA